MEKRKVIVAGAGIAGLTLARELSAEFHVTVIEAQNRLGGRIHTVTEAGMPVERGAEFVHGTLPATMKLVREAGLTLVPTQGKMYRSVNGRLQAEEEMILHWDLLIQRMEELKQDMTLRDFLDYHFDGPDYEEIRKQAIRFAEGFDLADPDHASVQALCREWSQDEGQNFRLKEGYGSLISFLEKECINAGCTILTGDALTSVEWKEKEVTALTSAGKKFESDVIIITVPVALLPAGGIQFTPAIDAHIKAAADIGTGKVVRTVLGFRQAFWPQDTGFIFSDEPMPTWWTGLQGDVHLLTGWAGGSKAAALDGQDETSLVSTGLRCLAAILGRDESELRGELVVGVATNWADQQWSSGGYSYATPATAQARAVLNEPVSNTIWFAGEGYAGGDHPGTVDAAIAHALAVAERIKHNA